VGINTLSGSSGTTTIGRTGSTGTNITNIYGTVNIGDSSGNGNVAVTCPINSTSVINAGKALDQASSSTIAGNVTLGDTGLGTQVSLNGQVACGSNTQRVVIGGAPLDINTGGSSGNITIGNGTNTTTLKGATTIGETTGNKIAQINGTFWVGDGTKQIAMSGSTLNLQNNAGSGSTTIGMTGQTSGQINQFLSSENRFFNPKICDNTGALTSQSFNLNSPSFCSFNVGTAFNSSTNTFTLPDLASRVVYLNLPNLPNYGFYGVITEYKLNVLMGTLVGTNGVSGVKLSPYSKNMAGTTDTSSRGRYCTGQFILYINRDPTSSTAPFTFTHYLLSGNPVNPFASVSFTYISVGTTSTTANFQPLTISNITGVSQSSTKIKMQINLPNVAQTIASGDSVICASGSFRVISSVSSQFSCAPNNSANGLGGEGYFTLS
jgi:hypothetical protein